RRERILPAALLADPLGLDLDEHRDPGVAGRLLVADAHVDYRADLHAAVLHPGAHVEPVDRAGEVAEEALLLLEEPPRSPHPDGDQDQRQAGEDEGADDRGPGFVSHAALAPSRCRPRG